MKSYFLPLAFTCFWLGGFFSTSAQPLAPFEYDSVLVYEHNLDTPQADSQLVEKKIYLLNAAGYLTQRVTLRVDSLGNEDSTEVILASPNQEGLEISRALYGFAQGTGRYLISTAQNTYYPTGKLQRQAYEALFSTLPPFSSPSYKRVEYYTSHGQVKLDSIMRADSSGNFTLSEHHQRTFWGSNYLEVKRYRNHPGPDTLRLVDQWKFEYDQDSNLISMVHYNIELNDSVFSPVDSTFTRYDMQGRPMRNLYYFRNNGSLVFYAQDTIVYEGAKTITTREKKSSFGGWIPERRETVSVTDSLSVTLHEKWNASPAGWDSSRIGISLYDALGRVTYHKYAQGLEPGAFNPFETESYTAYYDTTRIQRWRRTRFSSLNHSSSLQFTQYYLSPAITSPTATPGFTFQAFPNPTFGQLIIRLPEPSPSQVELLSLQGQRVWQQMGLGQELHLDIRPLPAGVYFLRVQQGRQVATEQVILQH